MNKAKNADVKVMPNTIPLGLFPNCFINRKAILFDNPVRMIAPDRINTPKRKKTALLPKKEKTRVRPKISKVGSKIIASRLVAAKGMDCKTHRLKQMTATPKHFIPSGLKPWGGGRTSKVKPVKSPSKRNTVLKCFDLIRI